MRVAVGTCPGLHSGPASLGEPADAARASAAA